MNSENLSTGNSSLVNNGSQKSTIRKRDIAINSDDKNETKQGTSSKSPSNKLQSFIGHFDHIPAVLKKNPFIHTGYRVNFSTSKKVWRSLFMIHNETLNVWIHFGGAICLILICIFLCFSVDSFDALNRKQFVHVEMEELFQPIYTQLPNISQLEGRVLLRSNQTNEDLYKVGENAIINIEDNLVSMSQEVTSVKESVNPETVGRLLTKLKEQLEEIANNTNPIVQDINTEKLEKESEDLRSKLEELQSEIINQIDSSKFNWIDVYRYIHPDYSNALTLKNGHYLTPVSRWPIMVFLFSAIFCLLCSAVFHLFCCLNTKAFKVLRRLDYAGVSILITGSTFPPYVYGFYCQPFFMKLYLSTIAFTSIIVFFVSLSEKIHDEYRSLKSIMYGGLGIFVALPIIHLVYLAITKSSGDDILDFSPSVAYYLAMGFSYLGGLSIYATKCPERFSPGKFDIYGHSHQIWHACVLLGIVLSYIGAFNNYYMRMKIPCIGCDL